MYHPGVLRKVYDERITQGVQCSLENMKSLVN